MKSCFYFGFFLIMVWMDFTFISCNSNPNNEETVDTINTKTTEKVAPAEAQSFQNLPALYSKRDVFIDLPNNVSRLSFQCLYSNDSFNLAMFPFSGARYSDPINLNVSNRLIPINQKYFLFGRQDLAPNKFQKLKRHINDNPDEVYIVFIPQYDFVKKAIYYRVYSLTEQEFQQWNIESSEFKLAEFETLSIFIEDMDPSPPAT